MDRPDPDELAPRQRASLQRSHRSADQTTTLRTFARLLVGAAFLGRDALGSAMTSSASVSREPAKPAPDARAVDGDDLSVTRDTPYPAPAPRHLLIGALFEAGDRIERRGEAALRFVGKVASPAIRWAGRSRLTAPARHRLDALSARGEAQVRRWVERGVIEEQRSRALLTGTVSRTVDTSLDRVVDSPQVQGLVEEFVQAQGQSMGRRFLEELRALGVSGDQAVTRVTRRILRHPKHEVPPFPRAIPAPLLVPNSPPTLAGRAAGFVSRLLAFMIDVILISICIRGIGWILEDIRIVTGTSFNLPFLTSTGDGMTPIYVTLGGGLLISAVYFVFFWTVAGITPGKAVMGLRVVTRDGRPVSLGRAVVRLLGYTLSTLLYGLGYWWIAVDNWCEGWHDKIARTAVIYAWDARPSDRSLRGLVGTPDDLG